MIELWPFQQRVLEQTQRALRSHKRLCLVLPTGSGKTCVSGAISQRLASELRGREGGVALYLVHRHELIRQTANTLDAVGLKGQYGVIAAGWPSAPWAPMQIASIPTLRRRLDKIKQWLDPAVLFIDEAHHARAETWERVIQTFPNAFIIGLTATPCRLDGKGLASIFDKLILGPQISELIPEYLAPVRTFRIPPKYEIRKNYTCLLYTSDAPTICSV